MVCRFQYAGRALICLTETTDAFRPYDFPTPGVPLIYDNATMTIIEIPTLWLVHIALVSGRTRSPRTWRSYAEAIVDWLRSCEASNWDWKTVQDGHLAAYRNAMLRTGSSYTGKPYARETINAYILRICLFYEWAYTRGFVSDVPFTRDVAAAVPRFDTRLRHLGPVAVTRRDILLSTERRLPHCYSRPQIKALLSVLPQRDRLIVQWALTTGARLHELVALDVSQIPNGAAYSNGEFVQVHIAVTKGSKPRTLFVPSVIVDETNHYIKFERRHSKMGRNYEKALWLSSRGTRLSRKTIQAAFRRAIGAARMSGRFHDLRHTYAINMLAWLMSRPLTGTSGSYMDEIERVNPLKALQVLLGHVSLASTSRYLDALSVYATLTESTIASIVTFENAPTA